MGIALDGFIFFWQDFVSFCRRLKGGGGLQSVCFAIGVLLRFRIGACFFGVPYCISDEVHDERYYLILDLIRFGSRDSGV